MNGLVQNIEGLTTRKDVFRKALYTKTYCEFAPIALRPQEEIGAEVRQFYAALHRLQRAGPPC